MASIDYKYIASLVDDARLQDSNAFASLFAITYEQQYSLAYTYLWDKGLVQETLLDIYLNALHSINRLERSKNFIKWLTNMNLEACEILAEAKDIVPPKGRPNIPKYPLEDAERLLEFIFYEEGRQPNTIPLVTLIDYNEYRMQRHTLKRYLIVTIILCFAIAPMFLITPSFTLELDAAATKRGQLRYTFTVDSFIPIETAKARIGDKDIPVLQDGKRSYYILPTTNGEMEVTVSYVTHRQKSSKVTVTDVDREVPQLVSSKTKGTKVCLYVSDSGSGINWKRIYALDSEGNTVEPTSYNAIIGELIFDYPDSYLNVYIPDRTGNVLHAVINHN